MGEESVVSEKRGRVKQRVKLVLFALAPATVLLIGAEACATFAIARSVRTAPDPETGQTVYTMRIGRFPWSRRSITPLNKLGFPDAEFDRLPSKGSCVHVVFAGDSFVFGDGVDRDSSFVALVRESSAGRGPHGCVRVFNLGERGTTIDRQAQTIRETMALLEPDVVILGQYQNDLTDLTQTPAAEGTRRAAENDPEAWQDVRQRVLAYNLNLVRLLSYHAFGAAIRRDIHYDLLSRWSVLADPTRSVAATRLMNSYQSEFDALRTELAANGIELGVLILPSKFGRFPEEEFFVERAKRSQVPYLRTFPILDRHRSPYAFLMYDGHLNELGNRLVAEALQQWLHDSQPAPFSALRAP
jgi:hypothetical protein